MSTKKKETTTKQKKQQRIKQLGPSQPLFKQWHPWSKQAVLFQATHCQVHKKPGPKVVTRDGATVGHQGALVQISCGIDENVVETTSREKMGPEIISEKKNGPEFDRIYIRKSLSQTKCHWIGMLNMFLFWPCRVTNDLSVEHVHGNGGKKQTSSYNMGPCFPCSTSTQPKKKRSSDSSSYCIRLTWTKEGSNSHYTSFTSQNFLVTKQIHSERVTSRTKGWLRSLQVPPSTAVVDFFIKSPGWLE